jgi:hypothetical protein
VAPYGCVARTEAAREAVAIHFLELAAYVCYLPRIAERRRNREGRRITSTPPLFSGYCFV